MMIGISDYQHVRNLTRTYLELIQGVSYDLVTGGVLIHQSYHCPHQLLKLLPLFAQL